MAQIRKTFSLDERTCELIELVMADKNITNSSELIRLLVAEESLRCGIIRSTQELNVPDTNFRQQKSDVMTKLEKLENLLLKMQHKTNDTEKMCYEIRDGVNTYLNFIQADNVDSADADIPNANIHNSIKQATFNFDDKMRNLSIGKSNFGKR